MIEDPKFPATSCDTCHGTGAGHTFGCGTCKGRGWVVLPVKVPMVLVPDPNYGDHRYGSQVANMFVPDPLWVPACEHCGGDLFGGCTACVSGRRTAHIVTDRIEEACEVMHDAYEIAAVGAGWETQEQSRKPWADVPEANKATMRAAVGALFDHLGLGGLVETGERCSWTLAPVVSALDQRWNDDTIPLPCITTWPDPGGPGRTLTLHYEDRSQQHVPALDVSPGDWVAVPGVTP